MDEKRRLPSWMTRKPVEVEVTDEEEDVSVVTECTKPKAKRVKEECSASDGDSFLVKCGTKRKKKEVVEKEVTECRDLEKDRIVEKRKRGRKGGERGVSRKKKGKDCELGSGIEIQSLSSDEEVHDHELTMEDMLMIAKEFVENDKSGKGQQQPSEGQREFKKNSSHIFSSIIAPQDTRTHNIVETASHRDSVENTSQVTLTDFKTTDDPAQDMLDLFLGPLLNKPVRKEETSLINDVVIPREITSQKHTTTTYPNPPGRGMGTSQKHDPVIYDKPITFAKKKSSLRDTVAMLLES